MKKFITGALLSLSIVFLNSCGVENNSLLSSSSSQFLEKGQLEHISTLLKINADYAIDYEGHTVAVDALINIATFKHNELYLFKIGEELFVTENLIDLWIGHSETVYDDKGREYLATIRDIKDDHILIDIANDHFILTFKSMRSNPKVNIEHATVRVLKPVRTQIELNKKM